MCLYWLTILKQYLLAEYFKSCMASIKVAGIWGFSLWISFCNIRQQREPGKNWRTGANKYRNYTTSARLHSMWWRNFKVTIIIHHWQPLIYYFQTNIFDRKFFLCDIGYDDALSVGIKIMTRCYSHAVSVLFEICYRFI